MTTKRKETTYVYVDAEFRGTSSNVKVTKARLGLQKLLGTERVKNMFICLQCRYVIVNPKTGKRKLVSSLLISEKFAQCSTKRSATNPDGLLYENFKETFTKLAKEGGFDGIKWVTDDEVEEGLIHQLRYLPTKNVTPVFFSSPIDLAYLVGIHTVKQWVIDKKLIKRRGYKLKAGFNGIPLGEFIVDGIYDLAGSGQGSAAELAESVGFPVTDKEESDKWDKSKFGGWLTRSPHTLIPYLLFDVKWAEFFCKQYPELYNDMREVVGLNRKATIQTLPKTVGSIAEEMLFDWFDMVLPGIGEVQKVLGRRRPGSQLRSTSLQDLTRTYSNGVVNSTSVSCIASRKGSAAYAALVQGGRCYNERPGIQCIWHGIVADFDFKSCYGSALKDVVYPFGLPSMYGGLRDDKVMTLGQFLKRYESEFVDGLYDITVSGTLPFQQNYLFSKRVNDKDIRRAGAGHFTEASEYDDGEPSKIPGIFGLFNSVIENGIITSHDLEVIRAVSTNNELTGWMNLNVVAAVWFPKHLRIDDYEEWKEELLSNPGEWTTSKDGKDEECDKRNRHWFGLSLYDYMTPLVDKRGAAKQANNKPLSNALKLPINSTFGITASPYKMASNVVVANNITAKARRAVWMFAMSCAALSVITDGGAYDPTRVRYMDVTASKFKRPGFQTFFNIGLAEFKDTANVMSSKYHCEEWVTKKSEGRFVAPLPIRTNGNVPLADWIKTATVKDREKLSKELDVLADKHMAEFFKPYGLSTGYEVDHKAEYLSTDWATSGKGNSARKWLNEPPTFKIRGAKDWLQDPHSKLRRHPMFAHLLALLERRPTIAPNWEYDDSRPESAASFLNTVADHQQYTYPGLYKQSERTYHLNISYFPFDSCDEYITWSDMNSENKQNARLDEWRHEPGLLAERAFKLLSGTAKPKGGGKRAKGIKVVRNAIDTSEGKEVTK